MSTSVPETVQELLSQNHKFTLEELMDKLTDFSYEEQDNFIYHLLQKQLKFHKFLLQKSIEGDKKLPNTNQLVVDTTKLEVICSLYSEIE